MSSEQALAAALIENLGPTESFSITPHTPSSALPLHFLQLPSDIVPIRQNITLLQK